MSDRKVKEYFASKDIEVKIQRYKVGAREVRYVETGADTLPMVLFVHGAPGGLDAFKEFLVDNALVGKAHLVSVDRPGYGYSGYGNTEKSIAQQAALIKPILEKNKSGSPAILVGHSYGGPVVGKIAMDYPKLVHSLVLAAPAIDPANEKIFWVSYPANWLALRWLVPTAMRVANDEKLSHVAELTKIKPGWKNLTLPITYIHGKKDMIVPFANTAYAQKMMTGMKPDWVIDDAMNHFVPWSHPQYIRKAVLKYLDQINAQTSK
ncbi:MAG TPA: alpha/beta hydrolase [Microscillaceae bacterium]|nr:alpha/beta hydrolase [Microscillaceae bacterium]